MNTLFVQPNSSENIKYLYKYLSSINLNQFVFGSGQPLITGTILKNLQIPLPPLPEQEAIAEALSDADAWIESLEQLIAKKRLIKQGAMQELLTPPSTSSGSADGEALEPWEVKKLGEVAEIYQPQTISNSAFTSDGYLVYGANGIIGKYHSYNHKLWQITITCRGSTCGTVNKTIEKVWITGNAMVVNVDNNASINKLFLYYLLSSYDFSNCITGSGQPQIVRSPLIDYIVYLPSLSEQTRIASILSDMDAELEALEQKLSKARQIKQGMMQELLTGKTRLIDN